MALTLDEKVEGRNRYNTSRKQVLSKLSRMNNYRSVTRNKENSGMWWSSRSSKKKDN